MSYVTGRGVTRANGPQARQGNMDAHMAYARGARSAIVSENRGTNRSIYGNPESPEVGDILPQEPVFQLPTYERASTQLSGLSSLNGLGAEASSLYPNDPELVRLVVRSHVQPIGLAILGLKGGRFQNQTGAAVALAGTNSMFQPRSAPEDMLRPGDLVQLDVPTAGQQTLNNIHESQQGVARGKYRLVPKRYNPENAATTFAGHLFAMVNNPVKYKRAMDPRRAATEQWTRATKATMDSYLGAGLLMQLRLIEAGVSTLDPTKLGLPATASPEDTLLALAQFMGVTTSRTALLRASRETRKEMSLLKHRIIGTIFYDGKNPYFEAFYKANQPSPARYANSQQPKRGDPYGELLSLQLDHFRAAVGGFAHAVHDQQRFVIGKATTGVVPGSDGRFHLMLGVARP